MADFIWFSGFVLLGFRVSCVFTMCGLLYFLSIYLIQKNQTDTVVSFSLVSDCSSLKNN